MVILVPPQFLIIPFLKELAHQRCGLVQRELALDSDVGSAIQ